MVAVAGLGLCIGFTLLLFIACLWVFLGLLSYWRGYPPSVTYHPQSELCKFLAQTLPPLQDKLVSSYVCVHVVSDPLRSVLQLPHAIVGAQWPPADTGVRLVGTMC